LLSVQKALSKMLTPLSPVGVEIVSLPLAMDRVICEDIISHIDLPLFDNSSMDGFAVRAQDVKGAQSEKPVTLSVVDDIQAGKSATKELKQNQAARIMTGAPMPEGANAVIPIENTDQYDASGQSEPKLPKEVVVYRSIRPGDYIRNKGEDISSGQVVLGVNNRLRPQDIGLLAMLGLPEIKVYRRPKVVILSTGDELLPVEIPLQFGKIHDSNAYALSALISRDGGDAIYLGIVPDREDAVRGILETAVENDADLILSSAGVSVGAFDFVRDVVQRNGELEFWRVNMRPGKPLAFGNFQGIPFVGLPGNPVSAFVGYEVFVRPMIMSLAGIKDHSRLRVRTRIDEKIESDGRESYLRAVIRIREGEWIARLTGHQGSGNLLSLVQANALLIIPSGVKSLPSGSEVEAWLLNTTSG
jgi:molybdopterin molybdotransferase